MKQNNKKVPDAPERYFVGPFPKPIPDIMKSCSFAAMNQWAGIKEKLLAEDEEYINISHAWHKITDMPDCMDENIVYLIGCFVIASSSIKKYIQTQQKGGK